MVNKEAIAFSELTKAEQEEILQNPQTKRYLDQQAKGLKKYQTTVRPENLTLSEWCEHWLQETTDAQVYVQMMKEKAEQLEEQLKYSQSGLKTTKALKYRMERSIQAFIKDHWEVIYQLVVDTVKYEKKYDDLIFAKVTVKPEVKAILSEYSGSGRTGHHALLTTLFKIVGDNYGMPNM